MSRKIDPKTGKKKRGCLGRIIRFAIIAVVAIFVLAFFLDDGDDVEYISQQEIDSGNEDIDLDELIAMFFDYYGYYPEDEEDAYNYSSFYDDDEYEDYDYSDDYSNYDNYYNQFDKNNKYADYYNDYYNDYSNYLAENGYDSYDDYEPELTPSTNNKPGATTEQTSQSVSSSSLSRFVECAKTYLGTPYVWGGTSRSGVDCSGLVYLAAKEAGLGTLPRTAKTLYGVSSKIDKSDLSDGDLVFFASGDSISHVAIYVGNNQILHAISEGSKTGVVTSKLNENYWKNHYYSSGRIMSDSVTAKRAAARARARTRTLD